MKYVAYYRVSTQKQGLGLEAQSTTVHTFIKADDSIIAEFSEKESGKHDNRPELKKALNLCKKQGATLLIAKLDRLSRNVSFLFNLRDSGVQFKACDCPEFSTLTLAIYAGLAQQERELISSRTKAALAEIKAKGGKLGSDLTNSKWNEENRKASLETRRSNARENECNLRAWGCIKNNLGLSYQYLAQTLNESHHTTAKGGIWRGSQVKRLIEMYTAAV